MRDFLEGTMWALGVIFGAFGGLAMIYTRRTYQRMIAEYRRMTADLENVLDRMRLATEEGEKLVKEARECKSLRSI
jgi:hypothetical protein